MELDLIGQRGMTRNRAIENLILACGYPFLCLASRCNEKRATQEEISLHAQICPQKILECPLGQMMGCSKLAIEDVQRHMRRKHDLVYRSLLYNMESVVIEVPYSPFIQSLNEIIVSWDEDLFLLKVIKSYIEEDKTSFLHLFLIDFKRTDTSGITAMADICIGKERESRSPCPIYPCSVSQPSNLFNSAIVNLGKEVWFVDFNRRPTLKITLNFSGLQ